MSDNLELLARNRYAADTRRASYYWSVERHGLVVVQEHDSSGILHKLAEIPPPPFIFHARAYRETDFPHYTLPIEPGQELIWFHFVRHSLDMVHDPNLELLRSQGFLPPEAGTLEEMTVFGRRYPEGREEVKLIYPDGYYIDFSSIPGEHHTKIAFATPDGHTFEGTIDKAYAAQDAAKAHLRIR